MATVTSTLKMIDSMTPVLKSVTSSINLTISAMRDMQGTMGKSFDSKAIDAARKSVQRAEVAIREMTTEIERAEKTQNNLNNAVSRGTKGIEEFARGVLSAVGAFYALNKAKELFSDMVKRGINFHALIQSSEIAFTTMLGNAEKAKNMIDDLYSFALTTPFQFPDLLVAGRNLIAFGMDARNVIPVLKSIGDAAAATGGGSTALNSIADAFGAIQASGRLSMQEINRLSAHGIPALQILANQAGVSAEEMRKAISAGAIDANTAIAALVTGIQEGTSGIAGETAKMGGMMINLKGTWEGAIDSLKAAWRNAGAEITEQHFTKLIDGVRWLTDVVRQIPNVVGPVVDFLVMAAQWVTEHWSLLQPILYFLIGLFSVLTVVIMANIAAWFGLNAALLANPFFWVATLVAGLIVWLIKLWKTNDEFAIALVRTWHNILNFFDRIPAYFWSFAESMMKPFQWWADKVGDIYDAVINGIIKGINTVLSLINKITGSSYELQAEFSIKRVADAAMVAVEAKRDEAFRKALEKEQERERELQKFIDRRQAKRLEAEAAEAEKQRRRESVDYTMTESMIGALDNLKSLQFGELEKVNKVNSVGRIEDTVDISSEDIKLMRELAELKSIQNFVTLTPTVNVTTGDIRNDADIDTIIRRIEESLEREIVNSAQGVFG